MDIAALLSPVTDRFRSLVTDVRGSVAMTFAIAAIPIVAFVGCAVDFSRANATKAHLQGALDSVALMLAKEAATDSADQLQANATKYFTAIFTRPEATDAAITASYASTGGSQLTLTATANEPTVFMGVFGKTSVQLSATSTTKWGNTRLRVALVLDNTGSMADNGKMTALQSATKNLLTQLQSAASTNGDVYVSIVPFVKDVNMGASNYNGSWIDWTDWEAAPSGSTPSSSTGPGDSCPYNWTNGYTCLNAPNGSQTSFVPSAGTYAGYICPSTGRGCYNSVTVNNVIATGNRASCGTTSNCSCSGSGNNKVCTQTYYTHTWIPNDHSTWNGCVVDRGDSSGPNSGNYDTNVVSPTTSIKATLYSAEQYSSCPQAAMGLSYDWSSMSSLVDNMSPAGNTNQAIGLQIGWMTLAGGGPFVAPAMDPNYTYNQIIILLTDGLNTQDRWYTSQSSIDARETITCSNIKSAGITLYTIQVNTGGDPTSTLLQNCATDSSKFFLLTSASDIVTTFNTIGTNLSRLYLSR
ncbi:MAG: pilus assembly protein TadG-related protein [Sphingomicrobium sp.]